ncbi:helix-turn-helix transcriptional regulator [Azospirillum brasilense]|uniref:helix-turn-helix transcriptional regulator n=1 Tax=Azospirillum brasilense TaxID=192 RepID=UPI001EDA710C|nr:hypothetical protein [Azospirillum brasilense]UKJ74505.1 hypothetical protein H1Q64_18260 [Azospirillum brasilense]
MTPNHPSNADPVVGMCDRLAALDRASSAAYQHASARHDELMGKGASLKAINADEEYAARNAAYERLAADEDEQRAAILATPASTAAGVLAKLERWDATDREFGTPDMALSALADLRALVTVPPPPHVQTLAAALDCLAFGVAVLGADLTVRHRNAAMAELIEVGDGFCLDGQGRIGAVGDDDHAVLLRLVAAACAGTLTGPATACVRGAVPDRWPIAHTVAVASGPGGTAVVVVASALIDAGEVSAVLQRDFGLTPAEAVVAGKIGNGFTSDQASQELGKAAGTGRGQVKSILRKLDRGQLANRGQVGLARWVGVLSAITRA